MAGTIDALLRRLTDRYAARSNPGMTPNTAHQQDTFPPQSRPAGDLAALARELVDKVGIEGAERYCHGLGWGGVLLQVENLRSQSS